MQQRSAIEPGATQLRDWMRRRGFNTQAEVAGFLEIDQRFVSEFLNEQRRPGLKIALVIERKTGIPVEAWESSGLDESSQAVRSESRNSRLRKM